MNKQLILNNPECFQHWLSGGELQYFHSSREEWTIVKSTNLDTECIWNWNGVFGVAQASTMVINDEYVEFRKALIEGITVQTDIGATGTWVDCDKSQYHLADGFTADLHHYRIKPNEPTFEIGDWITNHSRLVGRVTNVAADFIHFTDTSGTTDRSLYLLDDKQFHNDVNLWQPQPNELCIFWDDDADIYQIAKYGLTDYNSKSQIIYNSITFDNVAPYQGKLPT